MGQASNCDHVSILLYFRTVPRIRIFHAKRSFEIGFRPRSSRVFNVWQLEQSVCRFDSSNASSGASRTGRIWSTSRRCRAPHCTHWKPSRLSACKRSAGQRRSRPASLEGRSNDFTPIAEPVRDGWAGLCAGHLQQWPGLQPPPRRFVRYSVPSPAWHCQPGRTG